MNKPGDPPEASITEKSIIYKQITGSCSEMCDVLSQEQRQDGTSTTQYNSRLTLVPTGAFSLNPGWNLMIPLPCSPVYSILPHRSPRSQPLSAALFCVAAL